MTFSQWSTNFSIWDSALVAFAFVGGWAGRKILDWLFGMARAAIEARGGLKGTFGAVFNAANIRVAVDISVMAVLAINFFRTAWTDLPASGKDVAAMMGYAFAFLMFGVFLSLDLLQAAEARDERKRLKSGSPPPEDAEAKPMK